jgi:hypothetical protein
VTEKPILDFLDKKSRFYERLNQRESSGGPYPLLAERNFGISGIATPLVGLVFPDLLYYQKW